MTLSQESQPPTYSPNPSWKRDGRTPGLESTRLRGTEPSAPGARGAAPSSHADDPEAQELLDALREDHLAALIEEREKARRDRENRFAEQAAREVDGAADTNSGQPEPPAAEAPPAEPPEARQRPVEKLDRETLRAVHKAMLRPSVPFFADEAGPMAAVYRAKEKEAPFLFALLCRASGTIAGFTGQHVVISVPAERRVTPVAPSELRIDRRFRRATADDPGEAVIRVIEETDRGKRLVGQIAFAFHPDTAEERAAGGARRLLADWFAGHPFLGAREDR